MQKKDVSQQEIDQKIVDFSFYLIQRGEAGHLRGAYLSEYGDSGGIRTIGYGTVTEAGYNHLNYRSKTVTEDQAVILAKTEMQYKLYEKCRSKFKDFDTLLPCYQALILDTTYQGQWTKIVEAFNAGDMQKVYEIVGKNPNKERAAVRMRAVEMGMLIEDAKTKVPNANPEELAKLIAVQMIEKYKSLNGTDLELTKDELALMYRSCFAAYGIDITPEQVETFALSFPEVASGMHGIGDSSQMPTWMASDGHQPVTYSGPTYTSVSTSRKKGDGSLLRTDRPTRGTQRRSLRDNYPLKPGWSVRPLEANIPTERHEIKGNVTYNRAYSAYYQSARSGGKKPNMIVIHSTENGPGTSDQDVIRYLTGQNSAKVSAHIVIGRDGTPYMLVPPERKANHAGVSYWNGERNLNTCSIGIEVVRPTNKGYTKEQADTLVAVVSHLSKEYDISADRVLGHDEIAPGRKTDPGKDFDPIWDALAKAGVALSSSVHNDIKAQLKRQHNVHADKLNPDLANAKAEDSIAYCPVPEEWTASMSLDNSEKKECDVPEGWRVVPLNLDETDEEETDKRKKREDVERDIQARKKDEEINEKHESEKTESAGASEETTKTQDVPEKGKSKSDVEAITTEVEAESSASTSDDKKEQPKKKSPRRPKKTSSSKSAPKSKASGEKENKEEEKPVETGVSAKSADGDKGKSGSKEVVPEKSSSDAIRTLKEGGAENITEDKPKVAQPVANKATEK